MNENNVSESVRAIASVIVAMHPYQAGRAFAGLGGQRVVARVLVEAANRLRDQEVANAEPLESGD